MSSRDSRWAWLTLFAMANLVLWVGVAVAAGLVVGDEVDLGVEALIRKGQATGVALWEQAPRRETRPPATPTAVVQTSMPAQTQVAQNRPPATITWPISLVPQSTEQPPQEDPAAVPISPGNTPTPEPEATLVSKPLLMANPEISSLAKLDAEMGQSAPNRAVQIRFDEEALNAEIAALWTNNPELPFRDVRADLQRDQVVVTGRVTILGFGVKAKATGKVEVKDCTPQLEITSISVVGVLTPKFVRDQVEEMILEAMTWYPADYPLCLEQIVLEETRLSIYGHRR
jgi:hypothetical protein